MPKPRNSVWHVIDYAQWIHLMLKTHTPGSSIQWKTESLQSDLQIQLLHPLILRDSLHMYGFTSLVSPHIYKFREVLAIFVIYLDVEGVGSGLGLLLE